MTQPVFVPAKAVIDGIHSGVSRIADTLKNLYGIKLGRNEQPGWLGLDAPGFVVLNSGTQNQQGIMTLDSTYDFVAAGVYQTAHTIGDVRDNDIPFQWDLQFGASDRHLNNVPMHSDFLGGRHMDGYLWFPKLAYLARNSRAIWFLTSLSARDIWSRIGFVGYRIYDESMLDLT
ncbi:MAG: hypothetical protein KKD44_29475 [Proteobacteria bacterium]|nr:hypothetical protein [Pseudomonadota bacterium]